MALESLINKSKSYRGEPGTHNVGEGLIPVAKGRLDVGVADTAIAPRIAI